MSIEQEKMIVESLSSLYPLQEFEEKAIQTILDAVPLIQSGDRADSARHYPLQRLRLVDKAERQLSGKMRTNRIVSYWRMVLRKRKEERGIT